MLGLLLAAGGHPHCALSFWCQKSDPKGSAIISCNCRSSLHHLWSQPWGQQKSVKSAGPGGEAFGVAFTSGIPHLHPGHPHTCTSEGVSEFLWLPFWSRATGVVGFVLNMNFLLLWNVYSQRTISCLLSLSLLCGFVCLRSFPKFPG